MGGEGKRGVKDNLGFQLEQVGRCWCHLLSAED